MGKIKRGILGGVSGKVGNVVGASWKGVDYLRGLPASYNDVKSEPQIAQRFRFSTVLKFLQPVTEFLRVGYKGFATKMTPFNAAFSFNYHNALIGTTPNFDIDYAKAAVSRGNLQGAINPGMTSSTPCTIVLTWEAGSVQGQASLNDTALVVLYNASQKESVYLLNAGIRGDETVTIEVPANYSGDEVHGYLSFAAYGSVVGSQARNGISNSAYAGMITVA